MGHEIIGGGPFNEETPEHIHALRSFRMRENACDRISTIFKKWLQDNHYRPYSIDGLWSQPGGDLLTEEQLIQSFLQSRRGSKTVKNKT